QTEARRLPDPIDLNGRAAYSRVNPGVIIRRSGPPQEGDEMPAGVPDGRDANASGSYRTMCVRTCDGYYFPISFATSPANFARDEQACRARCPGARVELYTHAPTAESDSMISMTGMPYEELP